VCLAWLLACNFPICSMPLQWGAGDPGPTDLGTSTLLERQSGWGMHVLLYDRRTTGRTDSDFGKPSPAQQQPPPPVTARKRRALAARLNSVRTSKR